MPMVIKISITSKPCCSVILNKPDVFSSEFNEVTGVILKNFGDQISLRIEGWLVSIKDDLKKNFEQLSFENSCPDICISIFDTIIQGNLNVKNSSMPMKVF